MDPHLMTIEDLDIVLAQEATNCSMTQQVDRMPSMKTRISDAGLMVALVRLKGILPPAERVSILFGGK